MSFHTLVVVVLVYVVGVARGDAQPDPALDWAAEHFGTPEEIKAQTLVSQRQEVDTLSSPVFRPAQAPLSPLLAIRDVQAPTKAIQALRKPAFAYHRPMWMMMPPMFVHSMHLRTPSSPLFQDPTPVPAAAPSFLSFASRHTAQIPIIPHLPIFHFPIAAYPHTAAAPVPHQTLVQHTCDDHDDDDDHDDGPQYVYVRHFPSEISSPMTLRGAVDEGPTAPAGIVQSSQPIITRVEFTNAKAHPSLRNTKTPKDSPVIAV
ncbi:hypothetical protein Pmani_011722 [Petrolisthes manimaculis]|uniref:Uncharacterized protein n=1 Tax=Petrolisthes manimaculis TaxID=1843537 RepID=A0AAE1UAY6_9EUCA|nr:hypothetical protein Pmani_011722 [Petrolisthes manimaculis]